MVTSQKPTAPVASPNAKPNQPAPRATPAVATANPTPSSGGVDSAGVVHRLEEALQLVESLKLTDVQKTKIAEFTQAQTARCAEAKALHQANHAQILALLTPDQQQKLQATADDPAHCHHDLHAASAEHGAHV